MCVLSLNSDDLTDPRTLVRSYPSKRRSLCDDAMPSSKCCFRAFVFCCLTLGGPLFAQVTRVPVITATAAAPTALVTVAGEDHQTLDFGQVTKSYIQFKSYYQNVAVDQVLSVTIDDDSVFKAEVDPTCTARAKVATTCLIVFGFVPSDVKEFDSTATITVGGNTVQLDLTGSGATTCTMPNRALLPTIYPNLPPGLHSKRLSEKVANDFGGDVWDKTNEAVINCYYATDGALSFFTQIKSIYNPNSASATVAADIGSYNFNNGMRLSLGTNIQAGSGGASPGVPPSSAVPTLASASAAQAAQNLFFGGNIYVYDELPLFTKRKSGLDRWHFSTDLLAREGVDVQSFTGTSTTATTPTTHFNFLGEGYYQYDANPSDPTQPPPLAIYIGGQYGYAYTAHRYTQEYGFYHKTNADVGDVSFGVLVTGQFNIAVMRQFGPSQKYIDSTTNDLTVINNFKSWSFGILYQSKGVSTSQ